MCKEIEQLISQCEESKLPMGGFVNGEASVMINSKSPFTVSCWRNDVAYVIPVEMMKNLTNKLEEKMNIKRLDADLTIPERETNGSAGYDLRSSIDTRIRPGQRVIIPSGFAWEIPEGLRGDIRPRSGLAVRCGIDVMAGVVDSDYRDEVCVVLINHGDEDFTIRKGDRIAQMVITPFYGPELNEVEKLSDNVERTGGFGSTGVN